MRICPVNLTKLYGHQYLFAIFGAFFAFSTQGAVRQLMSISQDLNRSSSLLQVPVQVRHKSLVHTGGSPVPGGVDRMENLKRRRERFFLLNRKLANPAT